MRKLIPLLILIFTSTFSFSQIQPPAGYGNNIILWLSPDTALFEATNDPAEMNDRIVEWHDISGGGFVFSNAGGSERPRYVTYQGKKVLNFVNGDLLQNAGIANTINGLTEFSIYIIIKSDDLNTDQGFLDSEDPDGADDILCMRYDASGANTGRTNLIKCGMQGNTPNNQIESQSNTQSNQLQALTLTWKQGEPINLYIDGVLNETSVNTLNSAMSGVQKILLGKGPKDTGNGNGWDGRIGTVIFYSTKMSADTVSQISGDLKSIQSVQSGNWHSASTWDCNCNPSNNAYIKINAGHTVTLANHETANNLIIASGGTLDLSTNNRRLTLRRDLVNNGNIIPRNGEIRFNGTIDQFIKGSATANFYDLTVDKSSGTVTVSDGNSHIQGTLDIQNGCLNANGRLTLLSNATGTARLAELNGSACINGNITMQRYIDAGSTDWRFFTTAVSGSTIADINDDFITSGFIGSDFPNWPSASNPWPSIYFYDETATGIQDNGFTPVTNVTNPISPGQGVWVWSGDTITGTQPFTIDVTGPANTGNINLPLTYTNSGLSSDDGWNMVGNPYPSCLDWDAPSITKTNINNAIYIWNPDLQQFGSYIGGIGTNGASNNIASSQAFWVQASSANPVITVTEASKTSVDGAFLKPSVIQPFRIKATNNYGTDEIVINFDNNSTNNFDAEFDAEKMTSVNTSIPRLASITNNKEFSINQLPEQEINIPIKITSDVAGLQQIDLENAGAFGNSACLILEDLFTGTTYNLNTVQSFTTFISDTTTVARFLLHIGAPININTTDISCFGNNDAQIAFTKNTTNPFDIIWKDGANNIISATTNIVSDTLSNLTNGTYYIETTDTYCGNRIDTIVINQPSQITSNFTVSSDTVLLGANFSPTNTSSNAINYLWNFGDGNTSTLVNPTYVYNQTGNYMVNLNASQNATCFENYNKLITVVNSVTGINDLTYNNDVNTWITDDVLNISLNNNSFERIELRNALGQIVYSNLINTNSFTVNMSAFSQGMYVITLSSGNNIDTKSLKVAYSK